jgi:hypothetical protein
MGHKSVCLDCKKSLNIKIEKKSERTYPCAECGMPMIILPHRFKPPKKTELKKWEIVKFFIENGFFYQHIYEVYEIINGKLVSYKNSLKYPENRRDAKEFVEIYRNQAKKS